MKADKVTDLEAGNTVRTNDDTTYTIERWETEGGENYLVYAHTSGEEVRITLSKAYSRAFKQGWEITKTDGGSNDNKVMEVVEHSKGATEQYKETYTRDKWDNARIKYGRAWSNIERKAERVGDDRVVLLYKRDWVNSEEFNKFGSESHMYALKVGETEKAYKIRTDHKVNSSHPDRDVHEFWLPKSGVRLYELNE